MLLVLRGAYASDFINVSSIVGSSGGGQFIRARARYDDVVARAIRLPGGSGPDSPHDEGFSPISSFEKCGQAGHQFGWVVVYPSGKCKVGLGLQVRVPDGLKPGETVDVPAQEVSTDFAKEGASAVVFFVTDVHLAENDLWKADLENAEQAARKLEQKVRSAS